MENLLERMQDEQYGVPVKTVKSFMSKIPSVFTGMFNCSQDREAGELTRMRSQGRI